MALEFYWKLSTAAPVDARRAEWSHQDRPWAPVEDTNSRRLQINRYDYLTQIARTAELTGFDGVWVPDEAAGEEPWIVTGTLVRETRRLKLVTQVAPGSASAVYHAKISASLQRFSGGRQAWAIDLSLPLAQRIQQGDRVPDAKQADRARELLTLSRSIWAPGPHDQDGEFFVVEKGGLGGLVTRVAPPQAWIEGGNDALALAAEQDGIYILPPQSIESLPQAIEQAKAKGLRVAAHLDIFTRENPDDLATELARLHPVPHRISGTYAVVANTLQSLADVGLDIVIATAANQIREVHIVGEQIISRLRAIPAAA